MNQLALEKDYYIQMQEEEIARLSQVCNPRYIFVTLFETLFDGF